MVYYVGLYYISNSYSLTLSFSVLSTLSGEFFFIFRNEILVDILIKERIVIQYKSHNIRWNTLQPDLR